MNLEHLTRVACDIAVEAGQAILNVYQEGDLELMVKDDASPLTRADIVSHEIIEKSLISDFPGIPLLSEESVEIAWEERKHWTRYWLIDPLDGTKEFIRRNGEFTVNIALIEKGVPVVGVVFAPVFDRLYWGNDSGAWCRNGAEIPRTIQVAHDSRPGQPLRVVASRSHGSKELKVYLDTLPPHECIAMGSSLKLCLVAEGEADLYPRLGPTMEWDTAAADAVVRAAGGKLTTLDKKELNYNKKDLRNPFFLAHSCCLGDCIYPSSV